MRISLQKVTANARLVPELEGPRQAESSSESFDEEFLGFHLIFYFYSVLKIIFIFKLRIKTRSLETVLYMIATRASQAAVYLTI